MNFTGVDVNQKKISIGLPIFNEEQLIRKKLESLLSQTFTNFELIISDNASTDSTSEICKEFAKKDERIQYYRQDKTILPSLLNYIFVLEKAKCDYFVWTAADDLLLPEFLEKNLEVMLKNKNAICSASQVKYFGSSRDYWAKKAKQGVFSHFIKKIIARFQNLQNYPTSGTFESKFRYYLKLRGHHHIFYGLYRTEQLKKIVSNLVSETNTPNTIDLVTMLSALRFGDFYVIDEVLMYRSDGGESTQGFFKHKKSQGLNFRKAISYNYPFTRWCFRNFGYPLCLKNLDMFVIWNLEPLFFLIVDVIRKIISDEDNLVNN
tara:strand:- start:128 stop:1087 length:960 start_codon:yes stop_codon:yes gene_type:complete